jgi:branched-chain amino acid transport system substrate-binding protein
VKFRTRYLAFIVLIVLALLALFGGACGGDEDTTATTATGDTGGATGTTLGGKDKIVIGAARPLSGPLSFFEANAFGPIYKMWVDEVNAEGGIMVEEYGKKLPVEMLVYDDQSNLDTSMRLLEKLMVEDKVDFVFPPASTAFFFAAAGVTNEQGYLLMGAEGGAATIREEIDKYPMFFGLLNFSNWDQMSTLMDIFDEVGAQSVAMIYLDDLHGIEYSDVLKEEAEAAGVEVVFETSIPGDTKDFSPILRQVQEANPDVLFVPCYPDQNFPMVAQMIQLGYNPKMLVMGPGTTFAAFPAAFSDEIVNGVVGYGAWSVNSSPELAELQEKLLQREGFTEDNMDYWGHAFYYAGLQMFQQAIEKAGTLDNEKVAEVLKTERFQTILGETWFDNQLTAVEAHPGQVGQWQDGVFEVIDPGDKRTADPIYPKPDWPAAAPPTTAAE